MPTGLMSANLSFGKTLEAYHLPLSRRQPEILQLNVGKLCNLTCSHCHVNAGPGRKEIINAHTVDRVLAWPVSYTHLTLPTKA